MIGQPSLHYRITMHTDEFARDIVRSCYDAESHYNLVKRFLRQMLNLSNDKCKGNTIYYCVGYQHYQGTIHYKTTGLVALRLVPKTIPNFKCFRDRQNQHNIAVSLFFFKLV